MHNVAMRRAQQCKSIEESCVRSRGDIMGRLEVIKALNLTKVSFEATCEIRCHFSKYLSTGSGHPSTNEEVELEKKRKLSKFSFKNECLLFFMYPSVVAESCDGESWPGLLRNIVLARHAGECYTRKKTK